MSHQRTQKGHIALIPLRSVQNYAKNLACLWFMICGHFFVENVHAQDVQFTQLDASDNYLNPAFAGSGGAGRLTANFRSQWPDMPQTYMSYRLNYDQPIGDASSGFGLYMIKDDLGDGVLSGFQLGFQYMYQVKLTSTAALNFGMQVGMQQQRLNWDRLQLFDQIDPVFGFNNAAGLPNPTNEPLPPSLSRTQLDLGTGVAIVTEKVFTGLSFHHLNTPVAGFYSYDTVAVPMGISFQAGVQIKQKKKRDPFIAVPFITWYGQGGANQLQIGSTFAKSLVMGGLYLKNNLSGMSNVSIMAGFRKDWLVFTYSYDATLGGLSGETGGAHEVGLIFRLEDAGKAAKGKYYNVLMRPSIF